MAKRQLLGELLIADGFVTQAQVDAALATQKKLKGRLGSNLVELGFIELGALGKALGRQFGVPAAERTDFVLLDRVLAQRLPARAAELYKAVPLAVSPTDPSVVRVAIADPSNLVALDEIAGILGSKIQPLVAPEMRIFQLLQRLYGVKPVRRTLLREGLPQSGAVPRPGQVAGTNPQEVATSAAADNPSPDERQSRPGYSGGKVEPAGQRARALQQLLRGGRTPAAVVRPTPPEGPRRGAPSISPRQRDAGAPRSRAVNAEARRPRTNAQPASALAEPQEQPHNARRGGYSVGATLPGTDSSATITTPSPETGPAIALHTESPEISASLGSSPGTLGPAPAGAAMAAEAPPQLPLERRRPATEHIVLPKALRLPSRAAARVKRPDCADLAEEDIAELLRDMPASPRPSVASPTSSNRAASHGVAGFGGRRSPAQPRAPTAVAATPPRESAERVAPSPTLSSPPRNLGQPPMAPTPLDGSNGSGGERQDRARAAGIPVPPPEAVRHDPLAEALDRLRHADNKDEVASTITGYLNRAHGTGLVLVVKGDLALGWKGCAPNLDQAVVEATMIPLGSASVFQTVVRGSKVYRGPAPAEGTVIHERLWKLLCVEQPREVLVAPVMLGSRVVNLVYTQSGPDRALPLGAEADISHLAVAAANAFQNIIRARQG